MLAILQDFIVREVSTQLIERFVRHINLIEQERLTSPLDSFRRVLSAGSNSIEGQGPLIRILSSVAIVILVLALAAFIALRWNVWTSDALTQTTDDAFVSADVTRLSTRVSGEVLIAAVDHFQPVRLGDLLVQLDPADYQAEVDQATAAVAAAHAAIDISSGQIEQQYATIVSADAAHASAEAIATEARQEQKRQQSLSETDAGTRQRFEQATAEDAKAQAEVQASSANLSAQHHQLDVLQQTKKQRVADLAGARAKLAEAKLKLGYTKIVAPFDGVVGKRLVQQGDYVSIGSNVVDVVPLPNVYVIANYKETQLTHVEAGQAVDITVDTFPGRTLRGHVERISPASGSQFALLPPDNATGNFTKVVQRIPVRIVFDNGQPLLTQLLPGMSVVTHIHATATSNGKS